MSGKWKKVVEDQKQDSEEISGVRLLRRDLKILTKQFGQTGVKPEAERIKFLEKTNEELVKEKDDLTKELEQFQERLSSLIEERRQLERQANEKETLIQQLTEETKELKYKLNREILNNSHNQFILADVKDELQVSEDQLKQTKEENLNLKERVNTLEKEISKEKASRLDEEEKLKVIQKDVNRVRKECDLHLDTIKKLSGENDRYKKTLSESKKEIIALNNEKSSLEREKRNLLQQTQMMNKKVEGLIKETKTIQEESFNLKRELDLAKEDIKPYKVEVNLLKRKCEALSKKLYTEEHANEKHLQLLKIYQEGKNNIFEECLKLQKKVECLQKSLSQIESEKSLQLKEIKELKEKISSLEEQQKIQKGIPVVQEKQVMNIQEEKQVKLKRAVYIQAIKDSSRFKRSFIESQVDLQEQKETIDLLHHHTELLKQEISERDTLLCRDQQEIKKRNREIELLKTKCQNQKQSINDIENKMREKEIEKAQLVQNLSCIQEQVNSTKKEVKMVTVEKQSLSSQLTKRNETISLLQDKIKLLELILSRGKIEYNVKLNDIRLLKLEIKRLNRELSAHSNNKKKLKELKSELVEVKRESLRKDIYNTALTELIRTPTNIHKWRIIESTEPEKFELIQKICALQKNLVEKTCQIDDLKNEVQDKERTIKRHKIRPFSAITMKDIQMYRKQLSQKIHIIKSLSAERNMFHSMASELKEKVDSLTQDLHHMRSTSAPTQRSERILENRNEIKDA